MTELSPIAVPPAFTVADLRAELQLTLADMAEKVGLTSKSQMHEIERTNRASVDVALRIEALSTVDGCARIDAAELSEDVRKARHGLDHASGDSTTEAQDHAA